MSEQPTATDVLAGIQATREADQATRLGQLLKAAVSWAVLLTAASFPVALVAAVAIRSLR